MPSDPNDKDKKLEKSADSEFRRAMGGVRPLHDDTIILKPPRPKPDAVQSRRNDEAVMEELLEDSSEIGDLEYGDEILFQRTSISRPMIRKLRRGQIAIQDELDLHGMSLAEAKMAIGQFLADAIADGYACVRIIHGKGHSSPGKMPILKPKVAHWLSQHGDVLACVSPHPVHGGTGAVHVLLKRRS